MIKIMKLYEFIAAEPAVKPTTRPAPPAPRTRPGVPGPNTVPSPATRPSPIAKFAEETIDRLFIELEKIKHTGHGKKIIKKLHKTYVK